MVSYIYDGTFEGLLTVFAMAISYNTDIGDISHGELQPDLFTEIQEVATDPDVASCFLESIAKRISRIVLLDIGYCFLSEEPGIEKVILEYVRLILDQGEMVTQNYANSSVFKIRRTCDKVTHEMERMSGFIRFRKLSQGIYYAPIAPDHNVIQLIAPHFKARFSDQLWLIHDTKRKTGIYYDKLQCQFIPWIEMSDEVITANTHFIAGEERSIYDVKEMDYQKIWDQYFQEIAIPERLNKRQQRQRMPERYWRYLVENVEG
jgi:probable DNA metabolism protein